MSLNLSTKFQLFRVRIPYFLYFRFPVPYFSTLQGSVPYIKSCPVSRLYPLEVRSHPILVSLGHSIIKGDEVGESVKKISDHGQLLVTGEYTCYFIWIQACQSCDFVQGCPLFFPLAWNDSGLASLIFSKIFRAIPYNPHPLYPKLGVHQNPV